MGHVSNNIYGQYLEVGRVEWFRQVPDGMTGSVVANINIDFIGEIKLDDKVHVVTFCTRVGTKSVQLGQEIYANDRLVTRAATVLVGFDRQTRETVPLLSGWEPSAVE